jgi:hypothetical protein
MKQIILLALLSVFATASFSQQTETKHLLTSDEYLKKSKKQKTAAWILLGGGSFIGVIGLATFKLDFNEHVNNSASSIFFFTGTAAAISSIPFFISSKKNKKKAASISLVNEPVPQPMNNGFVYRPLRSLNFKINL